MRAQLIIVMSLLVSVALISPVYAATGHVEIWGTTKSGAQTNTTVTTAPNNVTITSWAVNGSIKAWYAEVTSSSDTLTYSIANVTPNIVVGLTVNNTPINAYVANSTGWVVFTFTQAPKSNTTYQLQAAPNAAGWNTTWLAVNGVVSPYCLLTGCTMTGLLTANAGIQSGDHIKIARGGTAFIGTSDAQGVEIISNNLGGLRVGSGGASTGKVVVDGTTFVLYPVQATTALAPVYVAGGLYYDTTVGKLMSGEAGAGAWQPATSTYTVINVTQNYTVANFSMTLFNVSAFTGTLNVTLPLSTGSGKIFTITKTDASNNPVQINVTNSNFIDGSQWANITTQWTSIDVVDIQSRWKII